MALLFGGCNGEQKRTEITGSEVFTAVKTYCDKEKNVEYMFIKSGYGGGLSLRYNTDGSVSTCK